VCLKFPTPIDVPVMSQARFASKRVELDDECMVWEMLPKRTIVQRSHGKSMLSSVVVL
jgi:hypothetical protein